MWLAAIDFTEPHQEIGNKRNEITAISCYLQTATLSEISPIKRIIGMS
jgi:hypothetical protein